MIERTDLEEELLEVRRAIRRRLIEHGEEQLGIGALFLLGGGAISLWSATIPDKIGGLLLLGLLVGAVVITQGHLDQCPRCEGRVDVFQQLRCARCGELLEEVPELPPEYHEALEELEAELAESEREPVEVADGVEVVA